MIQKKLKWAKRKKEKLSKLTKATLEDKRRGMVRDWIKERKIKRDL
jgi:hypothetical protein